MRNKVVILLACLLPASIVLAECNKGNVYEDIDCLGVQLKKDKKDLNSTYSKLYGSLDTDGQLLLESSQKAWLTYREKQCNGILSHFSSQAQGAGSHLIILSCEADKTSQRLAELKELQ